MIARIDECFESGFDQGGGSSAKDGLLTEEVGLGLFLEGGLDHARPSSADSLGIGQGDVQGVAGSVLLDSNQGGNARSLPVYLTHHVSRALGSNHGHIHLRRRHDLTEVNVEPVAEHQGLAGRQVGLDRALEDCPLRLVGNQDHDHLGLSRSLFHGADLEAFALSLGPGPAPLVQSDHHVQAAVSEIQGMGMSLTAVADDGNSLFFQVSQICIFIVINFCH